MSEQERNFEVNRIYVKDVSVETPNTPEIFTVAWEPEIELGLGNATQVLDEEEGILEVVLTVTVTAKIKDKTAYIIEVEQAGIFTVKGFDDGEKAYFVGAMIPNILFPYVRETISTLSQKAGFPAMLLNPIDFNLVYQQQLESQLEQNADTEEA